MSGTGASDRRRCPCVRTLFCVPLSKILCSTEISMSKVGSPPAGRWSMPKRVTKSLYSAGVSGPAQDDGAPGCVMMTTCSG